MRLTYYSVIETNLLFCYFYLDIKSLSLKSAFSNQWYNSSVFWYLKVILFNLICFLLHCFLFFSISTFYLFFPAFFYFLFLYFFCSQIDSPFLFSSSNHWRILSQLAQSLNQIANERAVAIVLINHVTTRIDKGDRKSVV